MSLTSDARGTEVYIGTLQAPVPLSLLQANPATVALHDQAQYIAETSSKHKHVAWAQATFCHRLLPGKDVGLT